MNLFNFQEIFNQRHKFQHEDLQVLKERWPNIQFNNIPDAWIWPIDILLSRLRYNNPISEIRQEFGQICFIYNKKPSKYQNHVIKKCESEIYNIDFDINNELRNLCFC